MNKLIKEMKKTKKPLIRHFKIWTGTKHRRVAEPKEPLKSQLKIENEKILKLYESLLKKYNIEEIPQAYRKNKNIRTNAKKHYKNKIWFKFDFKNFYDSITIFDVIDYLEIIYPDIKSKTKEYEKCFIDDRTNGLIQGSPVSGTLAGIALIKFWIKLKKALPNATITQYSDDLCLSGTKLTQKEITNIITKTMKTCKLNVKINNKKTRKETNQYRRLTGVSCNHDDKLTTRREDYRKYRAIFHAMEKEEPKKVLSHINIEIEQFLGKLYFMQYIDETGKIDKIMQKYKKHIDRLKKSSI